MSDHSKIDWTDATWNPVRGCTRYSPGCVNCYAETFAERWRGIKDHPYERGFDAREAPDQLDVPKNWRRPRRIFTASMGDVFHDAIPDAYIRRIFEVMTNTPRHTFQVLTKRSKRLRALAPSLPWPKNIWIGVSVEDRRRAHRILDLCAVECEGIRFLSVEPLLERVDLGLLGTLPADMGLGYTLVANRIGWVIVGGESGAGARPCDPAWLRSVVVECKLAAVPVFVKQIGTLTSRALGLGGGKGNDPEAWPDGLADLRLREFPDEDRG